MGTENPVSMHMEVYIMAIEGIVTNTQNISDVTANKPVIPTTEVEKVSVQPASETNNMKKDMDEKPQDEDVLDKKLKDALSMANNKMKLTQPSTRCEFTYHEKTNRVSIKLVDKETNEVVKEIPPEKTIKMIEKLWEIAGLLVDEKL
jgi:flagellar protein FlaG